MRLISYSSCFFVLSLENAEFVGGEFSVEEEEIDLSEYKFPKFAATYFQGNSTHTFSKKKLKQSLLPLKHEVDQLVSYAVSEVREYKLGLRINKIIIYYYVRK